MNILFFSLLGAVFTVAGGSMPLLKRDLGQRRLSWLVAFSAGVLLSTGLNHMLVESYRTTGQWAMLAVSLGFIVLYVVEKTTMIHACQEEGCEVHHFGAFALTGIGFHSLLDGFAIAVSMEFNVTLGMLVILAVLLHRLPTGISISSVMLANQYSLRRAWTLLSIIAASILGGTVIGMLLPFRAEARLGGLSLAVGLSAGTFLYIATSDLLPMAHQNARDYGVPIAFLVGFVGILGTAFVKVFE